MFKGRRRELAKLNALWQTESFQLPVIYGRRWVGKTALIRQFCHNKAPVLFFTASEADCNENLLSLQKAIWQDNSSAPPFSSFYEALNYLFVESQKQRLLVVFDEYPYLAKSYEPLSSILQKLIDQYHEQSKLFLILCGSSMSFMEENLLEAKSPLYGRCTAQFKILPFDFFETALFFPEYSSTDQAAMYGILDGIPHYLLQMDRSKSVSANLEQKILEPSSFLFEEPLNLLKQEIQNAAAYNSILRSIANGASRESEISTKTHLPIDLTSIHPKPHDSGPFAL